MKQLFYIFFICTLGCNKTTQKQNLNKNIQRSVITSNSIVNPGFTYENSRDTIKTDTFKLKNNYTLIIYPTKDSTEKKGVINYRIINKNFDKKFLLSDNLTKNYIPSFQNIDFVNYFALHSNGGGTKNLYFWLYDKRTGLEVLTDSNFKIQLDFDLKNELILYIDEDDNYNIYIYNVNTKVKTLIKIPNDLMNKQECTKYNDTYKTTYIRRVTNKYYYLGFRSCEPSSVEFRVKKPDGADLQSVPTK